eukprot:Opistho-2@27677
MTDLVTAMFPAPKDLCAHAAARVWFGSASALSGELAAVAGQGEHLRAWGAWTRMAEKKTAVPTSARERPTTYLAARVGYKPWVRRRIDRLSAEAHVFRRLMSLDVILGTALGTTPHPGPIPLVGPRTNFTQIGIRRRLKLLAGYAITHPRLHTCDVVHAKTYATIPHGICTADGPDAYETHL